ncbi:MAG: adenylosuccinate lyase [Bacteroidales bacterium]|nr:adenylosuccinate lyase [Bacteroidales bacterium]
MELSTLNAISPVDGRYRKQTEALAYYFSEGALINYRLLVEVEYFIALALIPLPQLKELEMNEERIEELRSIYRNFTFKEAEKVKEIEKTTNHDVKAVEYYLKKQFDKIGLSKYKEFIHFGLTSQDINNTAIPFALKLAYEEVIAPLLNGVFDIILQKAKKWKNVVMLAHTHGQPASPTYLGKEIYVFAERLRRQSMLMRPIPYSAKFGGATGNFNAHHAAYPDIDWVKFADTFVKDHLGMIRQKTTTQIEHYDNLAAFFDGIRRMNTILIDLDRDFWSYISMGYFRQKIKKGEVGSSTMPHKVNPIDFENSEGNLQIANALFDHLSETLPVSRMQRDLTDSTVTRNIGIPIAHSVIAYKSLIKGLNKLLVNEEAIKKDLEENPAVITEAIQTILRRENYPKPYEALKELTRKNEVIDLKAIDNFIDQLNVSEEVKSELKAIRPHNYAGINMLSRKNKRK